MAESESMRICRRMDRIGRKIMIMSGKGGVGKTTVTVNLAKALSRAGYKVGILDTDIHGPNIAKMLGCENAVLEGSEGEIQPVTVQGMKVVSLSFALENPSDAIVFRGPMKLNVIKQFLADVNWGDLDYLLIDTPPGTGDEQLAAAQNIPALAGCIIVTTPQAVSVLDSKRTVSFANQLKLRVLGVVENMSGLVCPHCGKIIDVFGKGGAEKMCMEEGVPLIGTIPLEVGLQIENGGTVSEDSLSGQAFSSIAQIVHSSTKPLTSKDIGYVPKDESCSPSACASCTADCPSKKG